MTANAKKENNKVIIRDFKSADIDKEMFPGLVGIKLILEYYGHTPSMNELMVYSGDAFNLCHATNWELRTALSVPAGTMVNAVSAYGFKGKWTPPEFCWTFNKMSRKEKQAKAEKFIAAMLKEIKKGRPVLYGGANGQCGDWRVLTGYDKTEDNILLAGCGSEQKWLPLHDSKVKEIGFWDAQVRGTVRDGFYGGWLANAAFIPGKPGKKPNGKKSAKAALKQAVKIFNAPAFSTRAYGNVTYSFGQEAYLKLAENLSNLDYPNALRKEEADGNPYGFYDMSNLSWQINQIITGRSAAAEFCVKTAEIFPESARNLKAAATAYRQEVELAQKVFKPFIKTKKVNPGNKQWRDATLYADAKKFLISPIKRKAGTEAVLEMLKLEQKAITEISKALQMKDSEIVVSATDTASNRKKIIAGVPVISWGKPGVCSFAAALEAACKVTKHPYSYNELMGDSALAFRVRWRGLKSKENGPWWCGSIPVAEFPDVVDRISDSTGWQFKSTGMLETQPEKICEYIPKVIESIDKGLPVVGYPTGKQLDCAVIYGYEMKDGEIQFYWRNLYTGAKDNIAPADNTGPWLLFMESWKKAPSAKKRFISALKQSVINWYRAPSGSPEYYTWSYGREALEIWINDLKNANSLTEKKRGELFFVNAWNFGTMRDARKNAVKYLEGKIKLLPEKAAKKLKKALDFYKDEVKLFKAAPDAFKGPMNGKKVADWTEKDIQKELKILKKALKLENSAIQLIEKYLKSIDIELKNEPPTGNETEKAPGANKNRN